MGLRCHIGQIAIRASNREPRVSEGLLRQGQPEGVRRDQGRQEVAARQRQQRRGVALQDTLAGAVEVQVKVADKAGEKIVSCS